MKKSEEVKEAIRQEILQRRYHYNPDVLKKDEQLKPIQLIQDLKRDYEDFECKIIWKILFIKRKLEKVQQKSLTTGVTSVNEKRLSNQLAGAEWFLNLIRDRIQYVEAIDWEAFQLAQTYEQRAKISNVFDMSHKEYL